MPSYPEPTRARRARRTKNQVPEPHRSKYVLMAGALQDRIDCQSVYFTYRSPILISPHFQAAIVSVPLPSQQQRSQEHSNTKTASISNARASVPFIDLEKGLGSDNSHRREMLGTLALGVLSLSVLFGTVCIGLGIFISRYQGRMDAALPPGPWRTSTFDTVLQVYRGVYIILPGLISVNSEILSLVLDLVVTTCTESVGYVHSVGLRSALASEKQLHYNTNLRLYPPLRVNPWAHPNGTLCNVVMAICLITAYSSSSMVFIPVESFASSHGSDTWWSTVVFSEPLLILGTSLLVPVIISLLSIWKARVLTWSSSPFDTTKALLYAAHVVRIPGKCMTNVVDTASPVTRRKLNDRQPSAWEAHPSVPIILVMLWVLAAVFALCGGINYGIFRWFAKHDLPGPELNSWRAWALLPNDQSNKTAWSYYVSPTTGYPKWAITFAVTVMTQGFLTLILHCSEVIVNISRDEAQWREASSTSGLSLSKHPLISLISHWPNVALLIAKPFLRECPDRTCV